VTTGRGTGRIRANPVFPPQGRGFFRPPTYYEEADAVLALIRAVSSHLAQTAHPSPALSEEARELLLKATLDPAGAIMRLSTLGGTVVRTGQHTYGELGNAGAAALRRGAIDELEKLGLVEDRARKGEVFYAN
jgi:hypothetical protein